MQNIAMIVPTTGDTFNPVFIIVGVVAAVALIAAIIIPFIGKKK